MEGQGIKSKCFDSRGKCIISCDKNYYRPLEVDTLLGNAKKAKKNLNGNQKTKIKNLVKEMVVAELKKIDNA